MIKLFKKKEKTIVVVKDDWSKLYAQMEDILNFTQRKLNKYLDNMNLYVEGKGISSPCGEDVYDENIGKQIAFKKAKLSANMKKFRKIHHVYRIMNDCTTKLGLLLMKINSFIEKDIEYIQNYNKDFWR